MKSGVVDPVKFDLVVRYGGKKVTRQGEISANAVVDPDVDILGFLLSDAIRPMFEALLK